MRRRLAPWVPRLEAWYAEGARTGQALWERARAAGFPGSRSTIYAWLAADATIRRGWTLVRQFVTLVRHRCGRALAAWVQAAETSGFPALAQFARSLRQDWVAVQAAVTAP